MHTASVLVALFVAGELLRRGAVRLLGDTNKALFAGDVPSHVV